VLSRTDDAAPTATVVELSFVVGEELVSTGAIVRTSDLGVGMGMEFTGIDEESKRRLQMQIDHSQ
jgi:hypothetical protein